VIRTATEIGAGLAPARMAQPIPVGQRLHVIGAAGAGASAAALLAARSGAVVTGCDAGGTSPYSAAVEAAGVEMDWVHDPAHVISGTEAVVDRVAVTKALTSIDPDHPELQAARAAGTPIEAWQQVIADAAVNQGGRLVAVAGTHGKSTSSAWLVHVLTIVGRDPAAFVGALLPPSITGTAPATARWGAGDAFVVEADEYAGNFDPYRPGIAVVLNLEWDHPDVFVGQDAVLDAFEGWLRLPEVRHRTLVANVGDPGTARLVERLADWQGRLLRVGLGQPGSGAPMDVCGTLHEDGRLRIEGLPTGAAPDVELRLPGRHNAANAICVAAAASALGVQPDAIVHGLSSFTGVGRRMEVKGEPGGVLVLDDYGHHPTAIAATISAVRERHPGRRLWAVYEPLTYHRTAAMLPAFADVLATADRAVIADIWPGRDRDLTITSAASLATAVTSRAAAAAAAPGTPEETADYLADQVSAGDVVLVMGGGRSYVIAQRLVERLGG
jgi:UDP-N-acetylmuramate--alanine ligase